MTATEGSIIKRQTALNHVHGVDLSYASQLLIPVEWSLLIYEKHN